MAHVLALRAEFPKDQMLALAARYTVSHPDGFLIEIGRRSRKAGFYTRDDFMLMCESVAPKLRCEANSTQKIDRETRICMSTGSERVRIGSLMTLSGISWTTGSVLLHYTFENQYPIFTPSALWSWGYDDMPGFTFDFWWAYVEASRALSAEWNVTMRTLDGAMRQFATEHRRPRQAGA